MLVWRKSNDILPDELYCGNRIVSVVLERKDYSSELAERLIILECTETGWISPDPTYGGYSLRDCVRWVPEFDILKSYRV